MKMRFYNVDFPLNFKMLRLIRKVRYFVSLKKIVNYFGIKYDASRLKIRPSFKPYSAIIEPSRMCTLNCKACVVNQLRSKFYDSYLGFDDFERFIDVNPQLMFIFFAGFGEPTLNKDLHRMIDYARLKGIISVLATNGTVKMGREIQPDFVLFSLDYTNSRDYKRYKGKNLFEKVKQNILSYNSIKSSQTITFLQFLINSHNKDYVNEMRHLKIELNSDFLLLKKTIIYDKTLLDFSTKKYDVQYRKNSRPGCKYIYYTYKLTSEGYISICCNDVFNKRTIFKKDYSSIWKSGEYTKIRIENRSKFLLPICKTCQKLQKKSPFISIE